jgi:hypothetical protein
MKSKGKKYHLTEIKKSGNIWKDCETIFGAFLFKQVSDFGYVV